ncbi:MAG: DUF2344 domain-containing protein [Clostridiales bacterium]|nr:DUF2344 domain-containing protein [Clostridiales bacterium]
MRMMVVYEKGADLRYIGHLDLLRTLQRALRRSGLPIQYSRGFNPHVNLGFAAPLSVGVVGMREMMEVPLEASVTSQEFIDAMNAVLPRRLQIKACYELPDKFPTLMSLVAGHRYTIEFSKGDDGDRVFAAAPAFMELKEYITVRKTKSGEKPTDIRPFIKSAAYEQVEDEYKIHLETISTAAGSLKPSLWFDCLCEFAGVKPVLCTIYRDAILSLDANGELVPMEELSNA